MCFVNLRSAREEEPVVPNRPLHARPLSRSGQSARSSLAVEARAPPRPRPPQLLQARPHRPEPRRQQQAAIIVEHSPRTSGLSIAEGASYRYGTGPVRGSRGSLNTALKPIDARRSGSVTYALTPRQSNASYKSTRERTVVVDDLGRRREYYR